MKTNNSNNIDLTHHILPNSATMVGVCIMVISIVKSQPSDMVSYIIDKALAIDSLLFMISALLSFLIDSVRTVYVTFGALGRNDFHIGIGDNDADCIGFFI